MMTCFLRRALAKDAQILCQIACSDSFCAAWSAADFEKEIANPAAAVFVIEEEQKPCAFICARYVFPSAEITDFAVLPSHKRRGLGSKLLKGLVDFLKEKGVEEITLEVNCKNAPALVLYEKNLFRAVSARKKFYNNTDDALLLKRNI